VFNEKTLKQSHQGMKRWSAKVSEDRDGNRPEKRFTTISNLDVEPVYTPEHIKDLDFSASIGYPGEYPFTRGCQSTGYRGTHTNGLRHRFPEIHRRSGEMRRCH